MRNLWIILVLGLFLTACVLPEENDPFERLPEEKTETLSGELFPFSVSIATRATHRLEKDGKLQGYLASDIVRLEAFEGREVEVEGVFRAERMRPIFWVEKISVQNLGEDMEGETYKRFKTKHFSFLYPIDWEYTLAPNGTAYFLDKKDPARRVFFTFSVLVKSEIERDPQDIDALISGFPAVRERAPIAGGKTQDTVELFSNTTDKVYKLIFTGEEAHAFEDLIESFIEGEENIEKTIQEELKAKAEIEAEKIRQEKVEEAILAREEEKEKEEKKGFFENLFGSRDPEEKHSGEQESLEQQPPLGAQEIQPSDSEEASKPAEPFDVQSIDKASQIGAPHNNVIDERAFVYQNQHLGFVLKSPYGYWFRNFGRGGDAITEIGFSDESFTQKNQVKIWLRILGDDAPLESMAERLSTDGARLIIEKKRSDSSIYRIEGSPYFRDMMWSVIESIE
jgi:hypothetical protein